MTEPRGFVVAPRFCGPPRSGNGGYVAGRLASFVAASGGAVEVTLRRPPPIGVRLEVTDADGGMRLFAGTQTLIAEAKPAALGGEPPAPVAFDEAAEAATRYAGRRNHPFPTCFVCGPDRARGDALRLQPGSVGVARVAAAWQPHESLRGEASDGSIAPEFAWAALDCPAGWSADLGGRPMVLGRISARVVALPSIGQPCVVVGEQRGREGRKAFTASALYSDEGELLAHAEHVWIDVDPARFS